jgi:hypothetical protein
MLDHRPAGDAWMHRAADVELEDNAWRVALREYAASLGRMGLRPAFVTPRQLADGAVKQSTLILPHAIALSDDELRAIGVLIAKRGRVIADVPPGEFDGHGRRRAAPSPAVTIAAPADLPRVLPLTPAFRVVAPNDDVDVYLFRSEGKRLLALQRRGAVAAGPEDITVELRGASARDIAADHDYGRPARLSLTLGPVTPIFLEIGP